MSDLDTVAVVMEGPGQLALKRLELQPLMACDVVVDVDWSGISTGTERLLWSGRMPDFPGMGYPLVPGYESVGEVVDAGPEALSRVGERVFVPGSSCFKDVRGLFGGASRRLVVPSTRAHRLDDHMREQGVLIALAATAHHAIAGFDAPELIIGHGVLGRLLARLSMALTGRPPTVWETSPDRQTGAEGYEVLHPDTDPHRAYRVVCDASGDAGILDAAIARLARGGEIVLAGFYERALSFAFPPAFLREARIRVAAEWAPPDLTATLALVHEGRLSLDGLITHSEAATAAERAYRAAFNDSTCLKMVLDWRGCA